MDCNSTNDLMVIFDFVSERTKSTITSLHIHIYINSIIILTRKIIIDINKYIIQYSDFIDTHPEFNPNKN